MEIVLQKFLQNEKGFSFFVIGIFLLLSAPSIASIFLLISLAFSIKKNKSYLLQNKYNYTFLVFGIILLITALIRVYLFKINIVGWESYLNLVGLANWLPFILCFIFFQPYLNNLNQRKKVIYSYLSGSIPLFISGFGQMFFNWHGPFGLFNNIIIWFQRPLDTAQQMTGLFNNPNYTGSWLLLLLPFCLGCLKIKNITLQRKLFLLIFLGLIIFSIVLTKSRNAFLGTFITLPFLTNQLILTILLVTTLLIIALIIFLIILIAPNIIVEISNKILPNFLITTLNINELNLDTFSLERSARLKIWGGATKLISQEPIFGWGSATFPVLFGKEEFNEWMNHTHNIILELALSYGLIITSIFLFTCTLIIIKSFYEIFYKNNLIENNILDKAWWTAFFTLFLSQMLDIQYFDFRVGITFWILLSGLICLIAKDEKSKNKNSLC